MKKIVLTLVLSLYITLTQAQILTSEVKVEQTGDITSISGDLGVGTTTPTQKLDVNGNITWGVNPNSWGNGLLSNTSGWNSGSYPTLGSDGTNRSLIMLHNPHIPFRTDNVQSGYTGRAGIKMATDINATHRWEMGLGGDFFYIHRTSQGEFLRIDNQGNIGIGTTSPSEKLDVDGNLNWGISSNSWGNGLLSNSSGWNSGSYPTLGSDGTNKSLIMLHNPHIPFRTDSPPSGHTGKSGIRMATDENATSYWDMGLAGDFFIIHKKDVGEFFRITNQGYVGIGTSNPGYKLEVDGSIKGNTLHTNTQSWSDFVFENDYDLRTLEEVEQHINENGHLPDIPSEEEVTKNGINLGEMDAKLLQKIEELTLYLIEQNKEIQELKEKVNRLEND